MPGLVASVRCAIERQGLVRAGERVGVAVSGGADSVSLLLVLAELRKELGIVLSVAHFNHKLRGRNSEADEKFVGALAARHGFDFHVGRADIAREAKRKKANLEDMGRRARYEFFAGLAGAGKVDKVAVAHTADDQAETVLAHILRGTGLAGLGGIHPRVGQVVRPLMGVRRAELRAYLKAKKQTWREDATNRDTTRMRARIRKKLLPLLAKEFQGAVVEHLGTLAELAREDEAFLEAFVRERVAGVAEVKPASVRVLVRDLFASQVKEKSFNTGFTQAEGTENTEKRVAIASRMVRNIVERLKPRAGQLGIEHVRAVLELAGRGENGKRLLLPGGVGVWREQDALIFCAADSSGAMGGHKAAEFECVIKFDGGKADIGVPELSCVFRFRVIDWPVKRGDTIEKELALDFDALQAPLVLRNWRPGDRLRPCGHRNAHKLKRLLSEKRVSGREREGWPVVTSGGVLVWARGFRMAAEFAANEKTRKALVISEDAIS